MTHTEAMQAAQDADSDDLRQYWLLVVDSLEWMLNRAHLSYKQA